MISKPKQKDLIEALKIAVNQITQLIPTNQDVMQACIDQVKDSGFDVGYIHPEFVEKFDNKKTCEECKTNIANRGLGQTKVLCSSCWNLMFK